MKTLKYIFAIIIFSAFIVSCSKDDNPNDVIINPVENLHKIMEFAEADHVIELYSTKANLEVGYNEISLRFFDKGSNTYLSNVDPTWMPMMHMGSMQHSTPFSSLKNNLIDTVYKGYMIFSMAGDSSAYWEITLDYKINGQVKGLTKKIQVILPTDGLIKTQVFTGNDGDHYILAFVNPQKPEVAINNFQALLYKMDDMMHYRMVENYKVAIDPRMPSMGNHSSPNNQDLIYNALSEMYEGKLSLTMTGYWKINMKLINENGEVLKGEDVTESNPESSLLFELEF